MHSLRTFSGEIPSSMFSTSFFASNCEKSRISFTRKSIRLVQFRAILRYFPPLTKSTRPQAKRISKAIDMPLRGFRNSCAACAKATVRKDCKFFYLSSSMSSDKSLTVVKTINLGPTFNFQLTTSSFLIEFSSFELFSG